MIEMQEISKKILIETKHLTKTDEINWLLKYCNNKKIDINVSKVLKEIFEFEKLLNNKFPGSKRFSIEGLDSLIPGLYAILKNFEKDNGGKIAIGTSHRGRIAIMHFILGMSLEEIFNLFTEESIPNRSGDVKYHLGGTGQYNNVEIHMLNNPSHLEFVFPVTLGFATANNMLPIIMHGDAAFCGQGIVYETFQLLGLKNYNTSGSINIILNNQIGFTTAPLEYKNTKFCTDLAKSFDIPVLHVNAEIPNDVIYAFELGYNFYKTFKKSIVIDLIGYRKYGHNELDDPSITLPLMYNAAPVPLHQRFSKHGFGNFPIISFTKKNKLTQNNFAKKDIAKIANDIVNQKIKIQCHQKIKKLFNNKTDLLKNNQVDFATAEWILFGLIDSIGFKLRFSGQDSKRGTFSQRHSSIYDFDTGKEQKLFGDNIQIINSPLSEAGVLGFEYGYSTSNNKAIVIWEAQYGDFANGAQVIIDQFISCANAKWGDESNIILLLPHGYEGNGPEHSSARIERFLSLSANNNWTVANPTTPANYFSIIWNQVNSKKPLILMSPKSLLRHSSAISKLSDLESDFSPILKSGNLDSFHNIIFCNGKIFYDLEALKINNSMIVRIEQLYPFPIEEIKNIIDTNKKIIWIQEEPKNMGAWSFIRDFFEELKIPIICIARKASNTTATGYVKIHNIEMNEIIVKLKQEIDY